MLWRLKQKSGGFQLFSRGRWCRGTDHISNIASLQTQQAIPTL
jgi:hypothetical protein